MRRVVGLCAAWLVLGTLSLGADVTVTQTITVEGAAAAAGGRAFAPRIVKRIKGSKARTDVEGNGTTLVMIADQATGRVITLYPADKTAGILEAAPTGAPNPTTPVPKPEATIKPTGQKRTIDGVDCEDHTMSTTVNFADLVAAGSLPPETAEAMKDVRIIANGTFCVAKDGPGIAEYMASQKNAAAMPTTTAAAGLPMLNVGALERLMGAASLPGLAYAGEMNLTVEGTGPMAMMMQQMGTLKVTTKAVSVSVDPVADELFAIPPEYKIVK